MTACLRISPYQHEVGVLLLDLFTAACFDDCLSCGGLQNVTSALRGEDLRRCPAVARFGQLMAGRQYVAWPQSFRRTAFANSTCLSGRTVIEFGPFGIHMQTNPICCHFQGLLKSQAIFSQSWPPATTGELESFRSCSKAIPTQLTPSTQWSWTVLSTRLESIGRYWIWLLW